MRTYPMCPGCRRADNDVSMALDVRDPCPHCGTVLVESLRACAIPGCEKSLPVTRELPVCRDCGIKIAIVHAHDAELWDAITLERRRKWEREVAEQRQRKAQASCVYYVRLAPDRIKIGFTTNLKNRLGALRVHPSALLAWEPGGRDVERQRHQQFAADRITSRLEDFQDSATLLAWIESVKAEHGLPRNATLPDTSVVTRRSA